MKKLVWERPKHIFRNGFKVFQGHVDPSDISQGMLGDCYFLSAISAIAENENRIKRIFL
jgi:calpain-15